MSFFREHTILLTSLGSGVVVGIIYWRITNKLMREIQTLSSVITELQLSISQLKDKIDWTKRRPRNGLFFTGSSGEEDEEIFEEAYGGSDIDYLKKKEEQIIVSPPKSSLGSFASAKEFFSTDDLLGADIFVEVDKLLEGSDKDKQIAYKILQKHKDVHINDPQYYWRLAKATFNISQIVGAQGDTERKKEYIYSANNLAKKALDLDSQCANAHKWFAITIGSLGEYEGIQEKIKNGFMYKEHIEKAIELDPDDSTYYYLLGRWCYSVYMLSWVERKVATTWFASPPTATIDEALAYFLKADQLNPGKWKDNMLFIAKCYIEMKKYKEAVKWLAQGEQVPTVSQDDKNSQMEITALRAKYQNY